MKINNLHLEYKEKIYEGVGGCIPRLNYINGGGGRGIKTKRRPNANLIRKGNRGGRCAGGGKSRYCGTGYLGDYIKNNLLIINLEIGG